MIYPARLIYSVIAAAMLMLTAPAFAQEMDPNMPGMDHGSMGHDSMEAMNNPEDQKSAAGSGTSRLPANEGAMHGVHFMPGDDWMVMLHGYANSVYTDQSGPRGDKGVFVQSMAMLSADKSTSWGRIQGKAMVSLEPLMGARGYPIIFASGETAGGVPLVDRQHPHDAFMELSARVDFNIGSTGRVFLYGGPVAEPALGPSAFMHRASATYNPEAPITHHWFDSTHISYGVVTAGIEVGGFQFEGSAFRGQEPDEHRWNIETPRLNSWSVRATWNPSPYWALQISTGHLKAPEPAHPTDNEQRTTASVHYANNDGLSAMAAFSAKSHSHGDTSTAWLAEANWNITDHHTIFGRIENARNDELFNNILDPLYGQPFRITKFQAGYAYRMPIAGPVNVALGGTVSAFAKPSALDVAYGKNPMGFTLFAKFSLGD